MHILTAYDDSPYSKYALNCLRQLPHRDEIDLSLVTVSAFPSMVDWSGTTQANYATQFVKPQREADEKRIQKIADAVDGDFRGIRPHLLSGAPGVEIVKLGKSENVDLIVCGAIGRSAISRVFLGSVSDYVATSAESSVLVIRPAVKSGSSLPEPVVPRRVLVGVGNAQSDGRLSDWIARLQLPPDTEIDLVYVMETRPEYELDLLRKASAYWEEVRSMASGHIETMSDELTAAGYRVQRTLVEAPHIGAALVEHANKRDCNLIIVGDRRETIVARILLGSTSRHVLRQAPCSVLIAR